MAKLLVPSQYATISAAITAAAAGDSIIISGGTYSEHLNLTSKTNLMLRGAQGETVTINCVLSSDIAVNLNTSTDITIRNIKFVLTGSTMGSIIQGASATSPKILECIFDMQGVTQNDSTDARVNLTGVISSSTNPLVIARCKFVGPTSYYSDAAINLTTLSTTANHLIEGNLFYSINTTLGSTDAIVKAVASGGSNHKIIIRNNTAVRCSIYKRGFYISCSSTSADLVAMYNNIIDETTVSTPAASDATFAIANISSGTATIQYNYYYHGSVGTVLTYAQAYSSVYANSNNCLVNTDPQVVDGGGTYSASVGYIPTTSPAYRSGVATVSTEKAARMDLDRMAFATVPSHGCYETSSGVHAIHIKRPFTNPLTGFALTYGSLLTLTGSPRAFNDPAELALYIELAVQDVKHNTCPFEFWYIPTASHRYRAASYADTFSLTTSSTAGTIMGFSTHSSTQDTG